MEQLELRLFQSLGLHMLVFRIWGVGFRFRFYSLGLKVDSHGV